MIIKHSDIKASGVNVNLFHNQNDSFEVSKKQPMDYIERIISKFASRKYFYSLEDLIKKLKVYKNLRVIETNEYLANCNLRLIFRQHAIEYYIKMPNGFSNIIDDILLTGSNIKVNILRTDMNNMLLNKESSKAYFEFIELLKRNCLLTKNSYENSTFLINTKDLYYLHDVNQYDFTNKATIFANLYNKLMEKDENGMLRLIFNIKPYGGDKTVKEYDSKFYY